MQVFESSLKFKIFLIKKLPLAWIAGLKKLEVSPSRAVIGIRYGYLTMNPFKSIYFAVMAMAAELSTGILALSHVYQSQQPISSLVLKMQADFTKKGIGKVRFVCEDGEAIKEAIQKAIDSQTGQTIDAVSIGYNENNEQVAKFVITWTFKVKSKA